MRTWWLMRCLAGGAVASMVLMRGAVAEDARMDGFPARVLGGETASAATVRQFRDPFDNQIRLADDSVSLEKTRLSDIQTIAGGTIHRRAGSGMHSAWLCYDLLQDALPRRIWFISQGPSMDPKDDVLTMIAAEVTRADNAGCTAPTRDLSALMLPVPGLRDDRAALEARFGKAATTALVRYASEQTSPKATVRQSLVYQLDGTRIVGVAFSQSTAH